MLKAHGDGFRLIGVMIVPDAAVNGSFKATLISISKDTGMHKVIAEGPSTDTFVNFQWIDTVVDPKYGTVTAYVLMGDVNSPTALATMLHTFAGVGQSAPPTVTSSTPDVSNYTFSAVTEHNGTLYATSPGLMPVDDSINPAWHLVKVDPVSGSVIHVSIITPAGLFRWHRQHRLRERGEPLRAARPSRRLRLRRHPHRQSR